MQSLKIHRMPTALAPLSRRQRRRIENWEIGTFDFSSNRRRRRRTNGVKDESLQIKALIPPPPVVLENLGPTETVRDAFDMIATSVMTAVAVWGRAKFTANEASAFDDDGAARAKRGMGGFREGALSVVAADDGSNGGSSNNDNNSNNNSNNNNNNNGGGDDRGGWEDGDRDGFVEQAQFVWVRNGRDGLKWLISFCAFSIYCFFFAHEPFWGSVWLLCAIGTGWGLFLVGSAVSSILFVINFFYRVYESTTANVLSESAAKSGGVIDYGIGIKKEAIQMIQSTRFSKQIPEPIEHQPIIDKNLNPNMPKHISLFGTDAQIVQLKLKPGESVNAEPGAMCYMSSNVLSITSMGPGGIMSAVGRVLAGEPFFINTFRNLGSSDGYIALGSLRQGDKIAVVTLKEREADLLCARDSYLCSMGDVSVSAAASFSQEATGGRTLSQVLKQRFRTGVRLILSKGNNIFNGEWLVGDGTVCITGKGTVMRRALREGEEMVVDARAVLALERTIEYDLELVSSPVAAVFGGEGLFHVRLIGPGSFYLQSLPIEKARSKLRLGGRTN